MSFEYRWADNNNDRLQALAIELVRSQVDVIVTSGTPGILAAKRATTTIPIVMATSGDPVVSGLIASLAQPGGNVTGLAFLGLELNIKRLELLKEAMPRLTRVGYLKNPRNPFLIREFAGLEEAGDSLKIKVQSFEARGTNEFESAFSAMKKKRVEGIEITQDTLFASNYKPIADLALKRRLISAGSAEFAEAGGMIGYGPSSDNLFRRSAYFVDKILKGAKPGNLPVEQPTTFEFVVNMKTARALGIKIPNSILVRATKVIE